MLLPLILLSRSFHEPDFSTPLDSPPPQDSVLLDNAQLWDGSGAPLRGVDILVQGGVIQAIEEEIAHDRAASWVDMEQAVVTPGLIDAHVHVTLAPGAGLDEWSQDKLDAHLQHHLRAYVAAGVTTVLDCAGMWEDLDRVHEWMEEGEPGPRVLTLGEPPTIAGGYGPAVLSELPTQSTPQDIAAYMAAHKEHGALGVKLLVEDGPTKPIWPMPEQAWWDAVIDEAEQQQLPLFAHAMAPSETALALTLQPRALLHAMTEENAEVEAAIAESGVYVVSTANLGAAPLWGWETERLDEPLLALLAHPEELAALRDEETRKRSFAAAGELTSPGMSPRILRWMSGRNFVHKLILDMLDERLAVLTRLDDLGVPLVMGSDAPGWPVLIDSIPGYSSVRELELLAQAGLSAEEVLIASTSRSAEMLGLEGEIGVIVVGASADLVVHNGDPLESVGAWRDVRLVMRDGVMRSPEQWMTSSAADLAPQARGPQLLQPLDRDGTCEVTELATGRVLARFERPCESWTLAQSPVTAGDWVMSMGFEDSVMASSAGALPQLPVGELDGVGYNSQGEIMAFSLENPEVQLDEKAEKAWLMVGEERVELDFEMSQMFNAVVCAPHVFRDGSWQSAGEPEAVQLYEGMDVPFCDGTAGMNLEGYATPGRGNTVPEGLEDGEVSPELAALSQDDFSDWGFAPGLDLALSRYWFEGEHLTGPFATRQDGTWRHLEGVEADGPASLYVAESQVLVCTSGAAHLYDRLGMRRIWTTEGACPAFWSVR